MIKRKKCPSADLRQSSIKLRSCDENRTPLVTKIGSEHRVSSSNLCNIITRLSLSQA